MVKGISDQFFKEEWPPSWGLCTKKYMRKEGQVKIPEWKRTTKKTGFLRVGFYWTLICVRIIFSRIKVDRLGTLPDKDCYSRNEKCILFQSTGIQGERQKNNSKQCPWIYSYQLSYIPYNNSVNYIYHAIHYICGAYLSFRKFYWCIVDLQHCVSFTCTAK